MWRLENQPSFACNESLKYVINLLKTAALGASLRTPRPSPLGPSGLPAAGGSGPAESSAPAAPGAALCCQAVPGKADCLPAQEVGSCFDFCFHWSNARKWLLQDLTVSITAWALNSGEIIKIKREKKYTFLALNLCHLCFLIQLIPGRAAGEAQLTSASTFH